MIYLEQSREKSNKSLHTVVLKGMIGLQRGSMSGTWWNLLMKPNLSSNGNSKGVDGLGAAREAMKEGVEGSNIKGGTVTKQNSNAHVVIATIQGKMF